jgi:hypothetical protein
MPRQMLSRSLALDKEYVDKAAAGDPAAQAWLALAKSPNIGEDDRLSMTESLIATIKKLEAEQSA